MVDDIKKVELHLHLDGSVRVETIKELSGLDYNFVKEQMQVNDDATSLVDYLKKFDLPLRFMQNYNNLKRIAKELVEDLEKDNVVYAEIRFAPNKHTQGGLTLDEVVMAVLSGLEKSDKVKTKIILCMMRGDGLDKNLEVIRLARKYNMPLDLAGDEKNYPNYKYIDLFKLINDYGLKFTIHSGEARKSESIIKALDMKAKRIGHGINLENDKELINRLKKEDVLLEICPTSNLNTKVFENIKQNPIYDLYKQGVNVSINTDNRTVSNTTLNKEYQLLLDNFDFTIEDIKKININSLKHSFLNEEEINDLVDLLK